MAKNLSRRMTAVERMAFMGGDVCLYNRVRRKGRELNLFLGECLIGAVSLHIARHLCEGSEINPVALIDFSAGNGGFAQDQGTWRQLTPSEVAALLEVRP